MTQRSMTKTIVETPTDSFLLHLFNLVPFVKEINRLVHIMPQNYFLMLLSSLPYISNLLIFSIDS